MTARRLYRIANAMMIVAVIVLATQILRSCING